MNADTNKVLKHSNCAQPYLVNPHSKGQEIMRVIHPLEALICRHDTCTTTGESKSNNKIKVSTL